MCTIKGYRHTQKKNQQPGSNKGQNLVFSGFYFRSTLSVTKRMIKKQNTTKSNKTKKKQTRKNESQKYLRTIPVVLIILFGVAPVAANILGVLPGGSPLPAVAAPTVVTARLPGGGFFTGTTTLLWKKKWQISKTAQKSQQEFLFVVEFLFPCGKLSYLFKSAAHDVNWTPKMQRSKYLLSHYWYNVHLKIKFKKQSWDFEAFKKKTGLSNNNSNINQLYRDHIAFKQTHSHLILSNRFFFSDLKTKWLSVHVKREEKGKYWRHLITIFFNTGQLS